VRSPYTPGFGGYLLAILIGVLLWSLGIGAAHPESEIGPLGAVALLGFAVIYFLGAPVLAVGLPLLAAHLVTRRVADQRVHVAVTGLAYLVPVVLALPWLGPVERQVLAGFAAAMALGRAAVIPLVPARRARRNAR
jgi:hypothetical protein